MTCEELVAKARAVEGQVLTTVTGKEFTVGVYLDCPYFVPQSTGLGRSDGRRAMERFVEAFNHTGSRRSSDYKGVTRNASYFIALIDHE